MVAFEYNWFCLQNWFYLKLEFVAFIVQLTFRQKQFTQNQLFSRKNQTYTRKWSIGISIENGINIRTRLSLFLEPAECFRNPNRFHGFDSSHGSVSLYRDYERFSRRKAEPETSIGFVELQETRWLECNGHKNFPIILKNIKYGTTDLISLSNEFSKRQ